MKFGKQNSYKTWLYAKPVIAVLLVLVVLLSLSVAKRYKVERDMADRRMFAEEELQQMKKRKIQLEERVNYLEGQRGIEEEIRKNFDVVKDGEQVIVLVGEEEDTLDIDDDVKTEKYPWYMFWR